MVATRRFGLRLGIFAACARQAGSALPPARPARGFLLVSSLFAALGFAGCAQQPEQVAATAHGKEYFPSSKYGPASRRVVADGQPIPRGGGQYLVGKPYTVAGQTYYPSERHIVQVGKASWYGDAFHGRLTANGEIYDRDSFTAAHPTLPLPSYARVTNLRNNTSMIVRVNDRGPYASNRIMDVSRGVADALDFRRTGTAMVKVEYVGHASLAGSDDTRLLATLRTNGPAQWQGEPTLLAKGAPPPARVASLAPYAPQASPAVQPAEEPDTASDYADPVTGSQAGRRAPRPLPEQRRADAPPVPLDRRATARRPEPPRAAAHREEVRGRPPVDRDAGRRSRPALTSAPHVELARLIEQSQPRNGRPGHGIALPPPRPAPVHTAHGPAMPTHDHVVDSRGSDLRGSDPRHSASRRSDLHPAGSRQAGLRLSAARDD